MNVFSTKSIGLYALAIGSAILFFNFVTNYGEANLKPPISVAGDYIITDRNLPDCLQRKKLLFKIQQSGIYLNANLTIIDDLDSIGVQKIKQTSAMIANKDSQLTFSGRLRDRQLDLSGSLPKTICPIPSQLRISSVVKSLSDKRIASGAAINPNLEWQGQLWLTTQDRQLSPIKFTATLTPPATNQSPNQAH
jgi:hypothetical protein